jgi:hypothetical protein
MESQDHVLNILRLFDSESLTISKFLQVLLSSRQYANHPLVVDLVQSHSHTISLFCLHGAFEGPAPQWVHESAEKQYQSTLICHRHGRTPKYFSVRVQISEKDGTAPGTVVDASGVVDMEVERDK